MGLAVPRELVAYLSGMPALGTAESVIPLLTVDAAGFPHGCLLSRGQIAATGSEIQLAVTSPGTRGNLHERGRGLLLVALGDTVHHCKLRLLRLDEADELLVASCELVAHKADSLGIALAPMTFVASPEIARFERWEEAASRLEAIAGEH